MIHFGIQKSIKFLLLFHIVKPIFNQHFTTSSLILTLRIVTGPNLAIGPQD
jgi:hypothetical protein